MRCRRMMFPASIWIKSNERAALRSRGTSGPVSLLRHAYLQACQLWDRSFQQV